MTKNELITNIADRTDLSKKDVEAVVKAFTEEVTECLQRKDKLQLVGFGTFSTAERAGRQGKNPITNEPMMIAPKTVAKWKPSKNLLSK